MPAVYAVGVGPGDPELLTRKAERVLRQADVIVAPVSNPSEASVALETIREFLDESRQEIIIHQFPMTADMSRLIPAWQEAARLIAGKVEAGKEVAFITIGDPLFYSTFIYLKRFLNESWPQIPIKIIPGISSINAAAAQAGIPVAEAEGKIAIIPATAGLDHISEALNKYETVVLLKVKPHFASILEIIRKCGREKGTVFVERVGSNREIVLTDFDEIRLHAPDYLSLMIITS